MKNREKRRDRHKGRKKQSEMESKNEHKKKRDSLKVKDWSCRSKSRKNKKSSNTSR